MRELNASEARDGTWVINYEERTGPDEDDTRTITLATGLSESDARLFLHAEPLLKLLRKLLGLCKVTIKNNKEGNCYPYQLPYCVEEVQKVLAVLREYNMEELK